MCQKPKTTVGPGPGPKGIRIIQKAILKTAIDWPVEVTGPEDNEQVIYQVRYVQQIFERSIWASICIATLDTKIVCIASEPIRRSSPKTGPGIVVPIRSLHCVVELRI